MLGVYGYRHFEIERIDVAFVVLLGDGIIVNIGGDVLVLVFGVAEASRTDAVHDDLSTTTCAGDIPFAIICVTGYSSEANKTFFSCVSLGWEFLRINGGIG